MALDPYLAIHLAPYAVIVGLQLHYYLYITLMLLYLAMASYTTMSYIHALLHREFHEETANYRSRIPSVTVQ